MSQLVGGLQGNVAVIGVVVSGLAASSALFYNAQQSQSTREQLALTFQGQASDRFTRAVDQLGGSTVNVRLGGVFALERLATDSPRDRSVMVEILSAFVREQVPKVGEASCTPPLRIAGECVPLAPRPDVQAALEVMGRRDLSADSQYEMLQKYLLPHNNFPNLGLSRAYFLHSDPAGSFWAYVDARDSVFIGTNLSASVISDANFSNATLDDVDLTDADLSNALGGVVNFAGAKFASSDGYTSTNFTRANMTGAILVNADLQNAELFSANLSQADLSGANLAGANLAGCNLAGANLEGAVQAGAVGYDLRGTVGQPRF